MTDHQTRLLVDTNVWLDNYVPERSGHAESCRFISYCKEHAVQLLYPVETIKDVFYLIASSFKATVRASGVAVGEAESLVARQLAWSCIDNMRAIACAVGADEADVWLAAKYRSLHGDFEDNLVLAAAQRANVDYLITRDATLIAKATVAALRPDDWLTLQAAQ